MKKLINRISAELNKDEISINEFYSIIRECWSQGLDLSKFKAASKWAHGQGKVQPAHVRYVYRRLLAQAVCRWELGAKK